MDHQLSADTVAGPRCLLRENLAGIARFASGRFDCGVNDARRTVMCLARSDSALRFSGIPRTCHRLAHRLDGGLRRCFDYYLAETSARLAEINALLAEGVPLPSRLYSASDSAATAAQHLQAVGDVSGAAAELAAHVRHQERRVQDVDLETVMEPQNSVCIVIAGQKSGTRGCGVAGGSGSRISA
jgi:hypothetical protein